MTTWHAKRFWKQARPAPVAGGFTVTLDGRPLRTPAKAPLVVPGEALAAALAAEWEAQKERVRPETMPLTRIANTAIDRVAPQADAVARMLAEYGGSDLLCYRAEAPEGLVARQAAAWDPLLAWAAETMGAPLRVAQGVMHVPQPPESLARLAAPVAALSPMALAAFHDLVTISGSLVLALAVLEGRLSPREAWDLSRIDERWQQQFWGVDDEAESAAAAKWHDFSAAHRFLTLLEADRRAS